MSSKIPPTYYFTNINFNSSFYNNATTNYITPYHKATYTASTTTLTTGNQTALGTYTIYATPTTTIPIGTYLFTMTASLVESSNPNTGIISDFQIGHTLGSSSTSSSNPSTIIYRFSNSIDAYGHSFNNCYSISMMVNITTSNTYFSPYTLFTIGTAFSSGVQLVMNNYTVIRIL